jgi:hypothetical protein
MFYPINPRKYFMLRKTVLFSFLLLLLLGIISCNCSKDISKTPKLAEPNKIPPGYAEIIGEIVEIEPITKMSDKNDPCSKAPCMAKVKIESASYGAGFPTLNKNDNVIIKFNFTLMPSSKDMFPNMDEFYPGLKVGDKFKALTGFVNKIGNDQPEYFVYGYSKN